MKIDIIVLTALSALTLQLPCLAQSKVASDYRDNAQQVANRYVEYVRSKLEDGDITKNQAQSVINAIDRGLSWADEICSKSDEATCKKAFYEIKTELQRSYSTSLFNDQSSTGEG